MLVIPTHCLSFIGIHWVKKNWKSKKSYNSLIQIDGQENILNVYCVLIAYLGLHVQPILKINSDGFDRFYHVNC